MMASGLLRLAGLKSMAVMRLWLSLMPKACMGSSVRTPWAFRVSVGSFSAAKPAASSRLPSTRARPALSPDWSRQAVRMAVATVKGSCARAAVPATRHKVRHCMVLMLIKEYSKPKKGLPPFHFRAL